MAARASKVLLLNSDVLVDRPGVDLRSLADCLDAGCAAVAPVLLFPIGTVQHAGMRIEPSTDFPGFDLPAHPGKHRPPSDFGTEPYEVPMLSGAAIMTTADTLREVGEYHLFSAKATSRTSFSRWTCGNAAR